MLWTLIHDTHTHTHTHIYVYKDRYEKHGDVETVYFSINAFDESCEKAFLS